MNKRPVAAAILLALVVSLFGASRVLADVPGEQGLLPTGESPAPPTPPPGTGTSETGTHPQHCITSPDQPVQCFQTEAEALHVASGGRIHLAPHATARSLRAAELFSTAIRAILYEHTNYTGATLTVYSDGCSGWNNLPANWNDRVSSVWTGSCGISLYEHYNLTGLKLRVGPPGTPYVGDAVNDQASSWSLP